MIDGIDLIVAPGPPGQSTWAELIHVHASGSALRIHREVVNPLDGSTVYSVARSFSYGSDDTVPYSRDQITGKLTAIYWSDLMVMGMQVVLVEGAADGGVSRLEALLAALPAVLPLRTVWPVTPPRRLRPAPPPLPAPAPRPVYDRGPLVL